MNYDPSQIRRPRPTPPPQQPQPQPAEAGADPAAVIAARSAAVARNRQQAARAALVTDVLRIVGVAVLIGGVCWYMHMRHKQNMEEERLRAEQAREEQAAREKARAEDAARREKEREAMRAAAAERLRLEEERKKAAARQAEEKRQVDANVKRRQKALDRFHGTTLDLISSAPAADLPAKVTAETWFSCVAPGGPTGLTVYEVRARPGKDIHVVRLDDGGAVTEVPIDAFNQQVAKGPFLLSKGTRCYYSPGGLRRWEMKVPVPVGSETFDPSRDDFRDLHAFVGQHCSGTSAMAYEVSFRDVGGAETRVQMIPFGGVVSRAEVARGLQQVASRPIGSGALQARLNEGRLIIRRRGAAR